MSVTLYKFTTHDNKTRPGKDNECRWGPGVSHSGTGEGNLCGPGYIHAYLSPALAVLMAPNHIPDFDRPKLWECSAEAIAKSDNDLKVGAVTLTTVREIETPSVTTEQRVIFAILCANKAAEATKHLFDGDKPWQVTYRTKMETFNKWADDYLAGKKRKDRNAANAAAYAAYDAAAYAACDAACDAAYAACDAANAANAAYDAAYDAAANAAYAATRSKSASATINLVELADEALRMKRGASGNG